MYQLQIKSKTHGEHIAFCDDEDIFLIGQYTWHLHVGKTTYYARTNIGGKKIFMHTLILGSGNWDHIDRNGLNCCKDNLRPFCGNQNKWNRRGLVGKTSKYKNVYWDKQEGKWRVVICVDNIRRHIGYYKDEINAAIAADDAMMIYQQDFAYLNFPVLYGA